MSLLRPHVAQLVRRDPPEPAPEKRQWREVRGGSIDGRARALTVLGPMRSLWMLRVSFWGRRHSAIVREIAARPLRELSFIHFARWTLIDGLPGPDGTSRIRLPSIHLYFEANFNGRFESYIDAFSYVIPSAMKAIFGGAYGFPGPQPATMFKAYIRRHDYDAAHYYSAYREHTVTEIVAALKVRARILALINAEPALGPEDFADAWRDLLAGRPEMVPIKRLHPNDPNYAIGGQAYALTVITAIRAGQEEELRCALKRLNRPFEHSPATHFARLVVIDRLPAEGSPRGEPALDFQYLLFSAVLDGDPDAYLTGLCGQMPDAVDAIWGKCVGAQRPPSGDPGGFAAWMRANQYETNAFFAPYGVATVAEVKAALATAERVRRFALRVDELTPYALKPAFHKHFVEAGE